MSLSVNKHGHFFFSGKILINSLASSSDLQIKALAALLSDIDVQPVFDKAYTLFPKDKDMIDQIKQVFTSFVECNTEWKSMTGLDEMRNTAEPNQKNPYSKNSGIISIFSLSN